MFGVKLEGLKKWYKELRIKNNLKCIIYNWKVKNNEKMDTKGTKFKKDTKKRILTTGLYRIKAG